MSAASEMWSSAENTSVPAGRPTATAGPGRRSFGAPTPSGGDARVLELPDIAPPPPLYGGRRILRLRSNRQRTRLPCRDTQLRGPGGQRGVERGERGRDMRRVV